MFGKLARFTMLGIVIGFLTFTFAIPQINAANLSAACNATNSSPFGTAGSFKAGETVTLTISVTSGDAWGTMFFNGSPIGVVNSFTGPGTRTASYTFSSDSTGALSWTVLSFGAVGLSYSASCEFTGLPSDTTDLPAPPDDRINWRSGDDLAILYSRPDDFDNPALDVYCFLDGEGLWRFRLTEADLEAWDDSLPQDVPLATVPECNASLYELDTGQIQINITLDAGKYYEIVCEDLNCGVRDIRLVDPTLWPLGFN